MYVKTFRVLTKNSDASSGEAFTDCQFMSEAEFLAREYDSAVIQELNGRDLVRVFIYAYGELVSTIQH